MADQLTPQLIADQWRQACQGKLAVLYGGDSAEREVSLNSGAMVSSALKQLGIEHRLVDASRDWFYEFIKSDVKHVFNALHGGVGEDGTLQGALQLAGISYTGSDVAASALALDKWRSKLVWQSLGVSTPVFKLLEASTDWGSTLTYLGGSAIVKPACEGSSVGMTIAKTSEALRDAYLQACEYDQVVLAECLIEGREFTVGVVGGKVLPVIEMTTPNAFYDYEAKYKASSTEYFCPANTSVELTAALQNMAVTAYQSLGCSGWGRVDFMADEQGIYVLEVNTSPGFTDHSLVPIASKAIGIESPELVMRILLDSVGVQL